MNFPPYCLQALRSLALTATSKGPDKRTANTALISWFRPDPVAVVDALIAAEQTRKRPGGVANQALDAALKALPEVERKEGVA